MITSYGNITVISSDKSLISFLRKIVKDIPLRDAQSSEILLIDQRDSTSKKTYFNNSIQKATDITKIYITQDTSYENLTSLLEKNHSYILYHPINRNLLKCIIEKINKDNKIIKYKELELNLLSNSMIYNGCKIFLNCKEISVLKTVIQNEGFASTEEIMSKGSTTFNSSSSVNSTISNINKKCYESLKRKILLNKYAQGYYIDI